MAAGNQKTPKLTQKVDTEQSADEIDRSCPICFEVFDKAQCREAFTNCGHAFCENCLQRTLKLKPFCPLCRQYQPQATDNKQDSKPMQLDDNIPWNPQVVRALFGEEEIDDEGRRMRTVYLSNGERTGIHVGRGCKINVSNNSNIIINGKRVQNPSDCNQQ
jgi:hypothetical protein